MSPNEMMILVGMTVAAMALLTFWRKVLMLMLSVAVAVFVYGLLSLVHLLRV